MDFAQKKNANNHAHFWGNAKKLHQFARSAVFIPLSYFNINKHKLKDVIHTLIFTSLDLMKAFEVFVQLCILKCSIRKKTLDFEILKDKRARYAPCFLLSYRVPSLRTEIKKSLTSRVTRIFHFSWTIGLVFVRKKCNYRRAGPVEEGDP